MADVKKINGYDIKDATSRSEISALDTRVTALENAVKSHVGMIIHSTTLDTEAKVIAIYGGTTWIKHSGYMLRGAVSGVVANSAVKTGGDDNGVASHSHDLNQFGTATSLYRGTGGDIINVLPYSGGATGFNTKSTGTSSGNLPNYKDVHIWERTV